MSESPDSLPLDMVLRRNASVLVSEVDGEVLMMDVAQGRYFGLDDIGSDVWRRLEREMTLDELVQGLAADYNTGRDVILRDVVALILDLSKNGLVELVR